jgi:hypothetical protein
MLKADWQQRPNARDVLDLLRSLKADKTEVYILEDGTNFQPQAFGLPKINGGWNNIAWKRCWLTNDSIIF